MTLTAAARCLNRDCDWTAAGDPGTTDSAADKHTRATGHPTATTTTPAAAKENK